jgi:hypothetical protein
MCGYQSRSECPIVRVECPVVQAKWGQLHPPFIGFMNSLQGCLGTKVALLQHVFDDPLGADE